MGSARGGVYLRLAVTLSVPIAACCWRAFRCRASTWDILERSYSARRVCHVDRSLYGIFSLQLNPFIVAAAAGRAAGVLVPRWRPLRLGGYPERDRLWTAVKVVALVDAGDPGLFLVRWMRGLAGQCSFLSHRTDRGASTRPVQERGPGAERGRRRVRAVVAHAPHRHWGTGNGFSVMIAAFMVPPIAESLMSAWCNHRVQWILLQLGLAAVAVAAVTRLAGGRPLRPHAAPAGGDELPMPSSGLQPLIASYAPWQVQRGLAAFGIDSLPDELPPEKWSRRGIQGAFSAGFCLLAVWLFNRPRAVEEAWRRAGVADADPAGSKITCAPRSRGRWPGRWRSAGASWPRSGFVCRRPADHQRGRADGGRVRGDGRRGRAQVPIRARRRGRRTGRSTASTPCPAS